MTETECQSRLRRLCDEMAALMEFLSARLPRLNPADREQARAMMKALKENLTAECRTRATQSAQARMSDTERNTYYPAICDAHSKLNVPWNSIPTQRWHSELWDARGSLNFYLH